MVITITNMTVRDIHFPTSRTNAGSDAKTPDACALVAALSDAVEQVNYKKTNCFKVLFGSLINSSFLLAAKLD